MLTELTKQIFINLENEGASNPSKMQGAIIEQRETRNVFKRTSEKYLLAERKIKSFTKNNRTKISIKYINRKTTYADTGENPNLKAK